MIEFFTYSWLVRISLTFVLGVCVLTQTIALVLDYYRVKLSMIHFFESLLEMAVLVEILILATMFSQVLNGYRNGFVVPTGYERLRVAWFVIVLILVIIISLLKKKIIISGVITASLISLPLVESLARSKYPWLFITALTLLLIRSIISIIISAKTITTDISALSVINAINTLPTGILFSDKDGSILLSNYQMQNLMLAITGEIYRDSNKFYDVLVSIHESNVKKAELDGQLVYLLADGSAWMFTQSEITLRKKKYNHISAVDVSEHWQLTSKLQSQNRKLNDKSNELKQSIANLHTLSKEKEIERAKMRAHDILGQRLTVMLRTIQNQHALDYEVLRSLSKGLLEELKAEQSDIKPMDELNNIQEVFGAIGVDIKIEGELPKTKHHVRLFIDIIREGSTNAVRHGFATQINIQSKKLDNKYKLTISNIGHTSEEPIRLGNGLTDMKKKVTAQGGMFDVIHHPTFTLSIVLPGGD